MCSKAFREELIVEWFPARLVQDRAALALPHPVRPQKMSFEEWDEPYEWCLEHFGPCALADKRTGTASGYPKLFALIPGAKWARISGGYRFLDKDDAFHFKMRWG